MFVNTTGLNCNSRTSSVAPCVLREVNSMPHHTGTVNGSLALSCSSPPQSLPQTELMQSQMSDAACADISSYPTCSSLLETKSKSSFHLYSKNKTDTVNESMCDRNFNMADATQRITTKGSQIDQKIKENTTTKRRNGRSIKNIPVAMRTGELTLKIFSGKSVCQRQLSQPKTGRRKNSLSSSSSSSVSSGPRIDNSSNQLRVELDKPVDSCPSCGIVFVDAAIRNSVFCLKTGNVCVKCSCCSTLVVMRNSFHRISPI